MAKKKSAPAPAKAPAQAGSAAPADLTGKTVVSLRAAAKKLGVVGYGRMAKAPLIEAINTAH